jgi:hypothetical protein
MSYTEGGLTSHKVFITLSMVRLRQFYHNNNG